MITLKDKWSVEDIKDNFSAIYSCKGTDNALKYLWELVVTKKINFGVFKETVKLIQSA